MHKRFNFKKNKKLVGILFIIYFIILMFGILIKNGDAFIFARITAHRSLKEKILLIQIIPFQTIIEFCKDDYISFAAFAKNIFGNIFAFSPLGFLLPILSETFKKTKNIFFIAFTVSLSIELIQLLFGFGVTDIDDIILNVLGAMFGFLIYKISSKILLIKKKGFK